MEIGWIKSVAAMSLMVYTGREECGYASEGGMVVPDVLWRL